MLFHNNECILKKPCGELLHQVVIDEITGIYTKRCRNFKEVCEVQKIVKSALFFDRDACCSLNENLADIGNSIFKILKELNAPQTLKTAINERSAYEIEMLIAQKDLAVILEEV